jgi:hypothetical protein
VSSDLKKIGAVVGRVKSYAVLEVQDPSDLK